MSKKKRVPTPRHKQRPSPRPKIFRWSRLSGPEAWLELLALSSLILIPLVFHHATSHSIVAKDYYAQWFALAFVLLGLPILLQRGNWKLFPLGFWIPLVLYLLYGTVRVLGSPYQAHSWAAWRWTLCAISPVLPGFLLIQRRHSTRRLLVVSTVVVAVVCGYGVLQFLVEITGIEIFDPVHWSWRHMPVAGSLLSFLETDFRNFRWEKFEGFGPLPGVCSTLGNPNFMAGFLVPWFPLFVVLTWISLKKDRRRTIIGAAVSALILVGFFIAGSRGVVIATSGMIAAVPLFLGRGDSPASGSGKKWIGVLLSVGISFLILGALAFLFGFGAKPSVEKDIGAVENRTIVFRATSRLISENWLWGVGPGSFTIRFPDYLSGIDAAKYGWMESPEEKVLEHAHSEPLEVWADLGLVGFLLWITTLGGWSWWVWKGWDHLRGKNERLVLLGMVAGVSGAFFQNLISVNLRWTSSAWIFWGLIGASAGWVSAAIPLPEEQESKQPPRRNGVWLVSAAILVMVLFLPGARRFSADWYFVRGRNAALMNLGGAEQLLNKSLNLDPNNAQTWYLLGGWYFGRQQYQKAIDCYEKVREIRGNVVVLAENMATSYVKLSTVLEKDFERKEALLKAISLYEESLNRHPSFPRLEDYLSRTYEFLGFERLAREHRRKAIELYEKWLAWDSSYPRPQYALDLSKNYFAEGNYEKSFWLLRTAKRWKANTQSVEEVKSALFQKDSKYKKLWEREEKKAAQKKRQPTR